MKKCSSDGERLRKEGGELADPSSWLVGDIVEKKLPPQTSSVPRPSILPFPIARHRCHGPHWVPVSDEMDVDEDDDLEDDYEPYFDHIGDFVQPIQSKPKKTLDFSRWRELVKQAEQNNNIDDSTAVEVELKGKTGQGQLNREPIVKPGVRALESSVAGIQQDDFHSFHVEACNKHQGTKLQGSSHESFHVEQELLSLKTQIDVENRALLWEMSPGEIAEAQDEIMVKLKPELLELLKKRGQQKSEKQQSLTSIGEAAHLLRTSYTQNDSNQNVKSDQLLEDARRISHVSAITTANYTNGLLENSGAKTSQSSNNNLWNAWTERVEAVRTLRFTLDGKVLEILSAKTSSRGSIPECNQHYAGNCGCRDYLKSDGDPAATGYTIKEAVALSRSMVPGQRGLALQLLASVLDKALWELQQGQIGSVTSHASNTDKFVDWMAVWAYALGPEPELALSLRMALDSNHNSVVMATVKLIHSILSCDMNESFFDISEKLATSKQSIYTAPIFRSRPKIDFGFFHGGFWKYSTKPSNILSFGYGMADPENEGKHTIHDDLIVAGQDFAAGLIRMEILPRIHYLLEMDPTAGLEECLISILIGLARHSPTCAAAIIKSPRLVETVVDRFTNKDTLEVRPSKIKCVTLLKVLAQSDKKFCINFLEKGIFQIVMSHLYRHPLSLDCWIQSGRDYCKLISALMIEQLRLWKVCVEYGYCISCFTDFFPTLCLWLSPPSFDRLIDNNLLGEFTSISREAYHVLESLVRRLPNLRSKVEAKEQKVEFADCNMELWCWSHAVPIIELALKWMSLKNDPYLSKVFDRHGSAKANFGAQDFSMSSLLWVLSAIMHMLSSILKKVVQDGGSSLHGDGVYAQLLSEYVFKVGLAVVRNKFLNFSGIDDVVVSQGESFIDELCRMRLHSDYEVSLSSVCCLHRFVQLLIFLDKSFQIAKREYCSPANRESLLRECRILEDGIITWSKYELRSVLITFMTFVCTRWHRMQSIETFGRGGPSPGVGVGWGASGGGFWSKFVLLEQTEAWLLMDLLEIFQVGLDINGSVVEDMSFTLQKINVALRVCSIVAPRDTIIMEEALNFLLQTPVLKYLDLCIHRLLLNRGIKLFGWKYKEEDFQCFSKNLNSHFRKRWLSVKKSKVVDKNSNSDPEKKPSNALETIYEDLDTSDMILNDHHCTSLVIEWSHQRLPIPVHWFLSPISTIGDSKVALSDEALEDVKSGLFLLLGLEAISSFSCTEGQYSSVHDVPLVWKLHSLSVALLSGMGLLQEDKSRDLFETLQELYGQILDELRCTGSTKSLWDENGSLLAEGGKECGVKFLKFQSEIHESYSTFVEYLVEQFGAVSYGDMIYSRQVAIYLHRSVEVSVRLAAWNALTNGHLLELLPPLEKCFAAPEGYLAVEDNEGILEAYVKSWISGALDKAACQGSVAFALALHHLSSFIFYNNADDKLLLRNKLTKTLLRDYSRKLHHEEMMLELVLHNKTVTCLESGRNEVSFLPAGEMQRRFRLLAEACEGNSILLSEVEKLKLSAGKRVLQ